MSKLKDLFVKDENKLYGKFTSRTSDLKFAQPFIERKPNDPNRNRYENDSRALPVGSSRDQIERIGKYLISPNGLAWLVKQRLLRAQSARPDLKNGRGFGITEGMLSSEILASLAPSVRGERYGSGLFGLNDERYTKSKMTTALGSDLNSEQMDKFVGIQNGSDKVNASKILDVNNAHNLSMADKREYRDFIPFHFIDVVNKKAIVFRATLDGINESVTPEWNSTQYIGRPNKVYTYNGVERTVNFSFTLYPTNANDVITNYTRYNYLVGLTFPSGYVGTDRTSYARDLAASLGASAAALAIGGGGVAAFNGQAIAPNVPGYMQPPFVKFTIGNMYHKQPGIITSISMTVPPESSWELGFSESTQDNTTALGVMGRLKKFATDKLTGALNQAIGRSGQYTATNKVPGIEGFKLPHILQINVSMTVIEKTLLKTGDALYGFAPRT